MTLASNQKSYGIIAKSFHWLCAALFAISYTSIYYRNLFADTEFQTWIAIQLHMSVGISFLGIIVLRLIWRSVDKSVCADGINRLHRFSIKLGHLLLYLVMIMMPSTGLLSLVIYLSNGGGHIDFFFMHNLEFSFLSSALSSFEIAISKVENASSEIHETIGRFVASTLILGHITAALTHHYVLRDNTLQKIAFSLRRRA
jgi:cytochrome b561